MIQISPEHVNLFVRLLVMPYPCVYAIGRIWQPNSPRPPQPVLGVRRNLILSLRRETNIVMAVCKGHCQYCVVPESVTHSFRLSYQSPNGL
jgi:hypothetical protein